MDDEQWPRLLRAFHGAKDFDVAGELATDVLSALRLPEEHKIVHPTLQILYVEPMAISGPLRDSAKSFDTQRRLSSHPVRIYVRLYSPVAGGESIDMPLTTWQQQKIPVCLAFTHLSSSPLSYLLDVFSPTTGSASPNRHLRVVDYPRFIRTASTHFILSSSSLQASG